MNILTIFDKLLEIGPRSRGYLEFLKFEVSNATKELLDKIQLFFDKAWPLSQRITTFLYIQINIT